MQTKNGIDQAAPDHSPSHRPWHSSYPAAIQAYHVSADRTAGGLSDLSKQGATDYGSKTALSMVLPQGAHVSLSFSAVDEFSDYLASYFVNEAGLQVGDVVAIQLPNCLHHVITAYAAWKAGLIVTNVNPLYTGREVLLQLQDSSAKLLVANELFYANAKLVSEELGIPILMTSLADFFPEEAVKLINQLLTKGLVNEEIPGSTAFTRALIVGAQQPASVNRHHSVALYQYTGGTTGRSKGAVITHHQMLTVLAQTEAYLRAFDVEMGAEDTVLTVIPMYHIFAFALNFLLFYKLGAHNVMIPNPRPLANVRPAFEFFDVTWMTGVDTLYAGLLNEPWFKDTAMSVKFSISGGTSLRPATARAWEESVGPIVEGYGLTETCCVVAFNPPGPRMKPGTVGLPVPGLDIRVVSSDGADVPLGQPGELWVRGDSVIQSYLNRPEETEASFDEGWFKTGDIVTMDTEGYIRIVDRKKDMINVSGFNVYPNEVEAIIAEMASVTEVAVVGVKADDESEVVKAVIVRRSSELTAEDVIAHCRLHLTGYKLPRLIEFVDILPKSPVGKILRTHLR